MAKIVNPKETEKTLAEIQAETAASNQKDLTHESFLSALSDVEGGISGIKAEQDEVGEDTATGPAPIPRPPLDAPIHSEALAEASEKSVQTIQHVLTDTESNLLIHAHSGPVDWAQAIIQMGDDYELMKDPYALPAECALRQERKEFRYRWLDPTNREKFNQQISGKIRWFIVNRANSPYVEEKTFDSNGLVRHGDMVLACMPWPMYLMRNQIYHAAAVLPRKKGKRDEEGRYEYVEGAKLRSGDIVMAEERFNPDTRKPEIENYGSKGRRWTGDPDAIAVSEE